MQSFKTRHSLRWIVEAGDGRGDDEGSATRFRSRMASFTLVALV